MLSPKSHTLTLPFQSAQSHALRQLFLYTYVKDQGRKHNKHKARIKLAVLSRRLLRLSELHQPHRQRLSALRVP